MTAQNPIEATPRPASTQTTVTIAHGDGIGPEIMDATVFILKEAGAALDFESIEIGERVYRRGLSSGIDTHSWESLRRHGVFLKGPITTPQGGGYKSLNVTVRKALGLYANIRPCVAYAPYVRTLHPTMDVVMVRENEEDLYAGIEHRQTGEVYQCLKLISQPGCEKIIRYAFEYARAHGRRKVSCFSKDNIMKMTDGLFHRTFDEVARSYPELEKDHWIIDIGAARLATTPQAFDVIVTPNLYGDIISDIAAELAGSVGMAGSANIGETCAMFEAIHGSAPDLAGRDLANPSGLLQAALQMLVHLGRPEVAERIQNAWLRTLEDGIHTRDIASPQHTRQTVGTREFALAVAERLGKSPERLRPVSLSLAPPINIPRLERPSLHLPEGSKKVVGVDVFLHHTDLNPERLGSQLQELGTPALGLKMITNRGLKVWPDGMPETFCTDHWRCRYLAQTGATVSHSDILALLTRFQQANLDFIKTENLYQFGDQPGYSLGQGE